MNAEYEQCHATTKRLYYTNAILECDSKQGAILNIINKLMHLSGSSPLPSHGSSAELAKNFALFFNAKIAKIHTHLENSVAAGEMRSETPLYDSKFSEFRVVTIDELVKIMTKAPIKSCQLDPIPADIFKHSVATLALTITDIVNKSFQSGIMPDILKEAMVLPLLKKPQLDVDDLNNYRPVSNLPYISKVIE